MFNPKFRLILILLIWLLLLPTSAEAQTASSGTLTPPETDDFPLIRTYLEVYDEQGEFIHNLQEKDIHIIEDQRTLPVIELAELETGVQFVVALNLGPTFAIRDSQGISRYETIQAAFQSWATNHSGTLDDLSFLTNDSPDVIHLNSAEQWLTGFNTYATDPRSAIPSLDVLFRAINIAADPALRVGMGRAIMLLTPPPDRAGIATLQSIISMAKQERVRVNVWMVSSPAYFSSEGASQLQDLANQTGGFFLGYSGTEILPDIQDYLDPLRYVYSLRYESKIRNDEPHQISAKIDIRGTIIQSETQNFALVVLPPNPIFLSPPLQIFRANRAALTEAISEEADYTPKVQVLKILIEFPDGRPRALARTTLYVDGKIADENTSAPFDSFSWDLSDYTTSSLHNLKVEVLDSYGLSNISIDNSIQITVQQTPQSVISTITKNAPIIAGVAVAFAGGILVLVLIIGGRIKPKVFGRQTHLKNRKKRQVDKKDPVTQPVPAEIAPSRKRFSNWINRFSWPQRGPSITKSIAYLEKIGEDNLNVPKEKIPISIGEITFGKDPKLATTIFNDKALNNLHTRIRAINETNILIFDEKTIAGTWVNFDPISSDGVKLSHGDIIHIGRIGFRFKMIDPHQVPKPIVIHQEPRS